MARNSQEEIDSLLELANLKRIEAFVGAGKPLKCICLICENFVTPRISTIKRGHRGCKFCASKEGAKKRKLEDSVARQVMINSGVEPLEAYTSNSTPWKSKCLVCGQQVTPQYQNVKNGHKACKFCSGKAITIEKATSIYLKSGAKPTEPFINVNTIWKGICFTCNSVVSPRLTDIQQGSGPCKKCGYKKISLANKLSEEEAVIRMFDSGAEPLEPWGSKKNSDDPWLCRCLNCDSIIAPTLHSITSGQGPCVHCGYRKLGDQFRFKHKDATLIIKNFGFEPLEDYVGANSNWLTKCDKCGSESRRKFANIQTGYGCRECAYKNSQITSADAIGEMKSRGWEPLQPYVGVKEPWKCKCLKCGEISFKRLYSLGYQRVAGCRICGERILSSVVYLMNHQHLKAYKIGVGG